MQSFLNLVCCVKNGDDQLSDYYESEKINKEEENYQESKKKKSSKKKANKTKPQSRPQKEMQINFNEPKDKSNSTSGVEMPKKNKRLSELQDIMSTLNQRKSNEEIQIDIEQKKLDLQIEEFSESEKQIFSITVYTFQEVQQFGKTTIVYKIKFKVNEESEETKVQRSFREFQILYEHLSKTYPNELLPEFPDKYSENAVIGGNDILDRIKRFDKILKFLALRNLIDKQIKGFLSKKPITEVTSNTAQNQQQQQQNQQNKPGYLSKSQGSLQKNGKLNQQYPMHPPKIINNQQLKQNSQQKDEDD